MFDSSQRRFAKTVSAIIECNPFLPERINLEKKALGDAFESTNANWNLHPSEQQLTENITLINKRAEAILNALSQKSFESAAPADVQLAVDLTSLVLFNRFREQFEKLNAQHGKSASAVFQKFQKEWNRFLPPGVVPAEITAQAPQMFAMLFQIRRAFDNIFRNLIGSSPAIIELRANVWRSIFTHDVRRYVATMFRAMADFPTLITGPTGSGKELVARAIGLSSYVPYDTETGKFVSPLDHLFVSLNLSAVSPQLIESELFGHAKGSFTGATDDHIGWLEACPAVGVVFLDEIGELDHDIQVKLLRVVQDRIFQRIGDRQPRRFQGRIISATNRNLDEEMVAGRFRTDFYYRLCADRITTPSLAERTNEDPAELAHLVQHLSSRITAQEDASDIAAEVLEWIQATLGNDYPWPGNVRELDQCIRSWLIRRSYDPCNASVAIQGRSLECAMAESQLTADELLSLYCRVKYEQNGSYLKTAQQLGIDRRTVKSRVDG